MRQWEIWRVDLSKITDPVTLTQFSEDKNDFTYCVIVTGQNFLDTYHAPTILPILLNSTGNYSAISIDGNKETGLFCESYITCDHILTIQKNIFTRKIGIVPENLRSKIQKRLFSYFME